MSTTRTFVAIDSDESLQRRAAGLMDRLQPHAPGARWVADENLHLTLMFLGDLSDRDVAEVCRRTEWTARANAPFTLRVAGVGAFPDANRPRALWMGVTDGAEAVCRLQSDLDEALSDLAARGENRSFVPHWTLARLGPGGKGPGGKGHRGGAPSPHLPEVLAGLADHDAGELSVEQLVVFACELRPGGPEYYPLATCRLGLAPKG